MAFFTLQYLSSSKSANMDWRMAGGNKDPFQLNSLPVHLLYVDALMYLT